jgi:hypothetical protein
MNQHIERWKHTIADNIRVIERLEAKEMRLFVGPETSAENEVSASTAARLREINSELQTLIDKHSLTQ